MVGSDLPTQAHSMIHLRRLNHKLRRAVETVIDEDVAGDSIETGVWRGGPASSCTACWPNEEPLPA